MDQIKQYLKLIRIKQYIKNFLIFIPVVSAKMLLTSHILKVCLGFVAISLMASTIYIINDIRDIENDKKHETKKYRPLASGKIKVKNATILSIIMFIGAMLINYLISQNYSTSICLMLYFISNIAYSFGLKNKPILDVVLLSSGYIIRVYYGAGLIFIEVSKWLFLTVLFASMFMGIGKRRNELKSNKGVARKALTLYNESFLDKFMYLSLGNIVIFYALWTMEQENQYIFYTIVLVIIILMQYSLTVEKTLDGDPTNVLLNNKSILSTSFIYAIIITILLVV